MKDRPFVLCLTNTVAANFTANCLLAVGAKPAMIEEPSEAQELASLADAILINLGTVTTMQAHAMRDALEIANDRQIPWVLDPVGIPFLSFRRQLALDLIARKPALIRGNHAEIKTLLERIPSLTEKTVLLSTGETDIAYVPQPVKISGGVSLLESVTATGCAQGGICAAFLGQGQHPREACLAASKLMKQAGELAFSRQKSPGSFHLALIDALWEMTHD